MKFSYLFFSFSTFVSTQHLQLYLLSETIRLVNYEFLVTLSLNPWFYWQAVLLAQGNDDIHKRGCQSLRLWTDNQK